MAVVQVIEAAYNLMVGGCTLVVAWNLVREIREERRHRRMPHMRDRQ